MSQIRSLRTHRRARPGSRPPAVALPGIAVLAIALILGACSASPGASPGTSAPGASASPSTAAGPSPTPVVRTILAGGDPAAAPGQRLELARYTIQPHTKLAAHHHPGMQLALIETGTLTYTVISGSVDVHATDGSTRTISAGQTGTITAGEWIAENEQIVHFGENGTDKPLTILASSLFAAGAPPAIVVSPAPAPSST